MDCGMTSENNTMHIVEMKKPVSPCEEEGEGNRAKEKTRDVYPR
jgi:hypothetical protein